MNLKPAHTVGFPLTSSVGMSDLLARCDVLIYEDQRGTQAPWGGQVLAQRQNIAPPQHHSLKYEVLKETSLGGSKVREIYVVKWLPRCQWED